MKKKFAAVLFSSFLMAGMSLPVMAASYPDVGEGDWYYDYVTDVSHKGLMTGYDDGRFGVADNLSRGQFATVLYRMDGSPDMSYLGTFPDVEDGWFYSIPAEWANSVGVITGYDNGNFGSVDNLTREQLATIMYRYAKIKGEDTSQRSDYNKFPDGNEVSSFAAEGMQWAIAKGIIKGNGDRTLNPQGEVSRAVCATVISRYTNANNEKTEEDAFKSVFNEYDNLSPEDYDGAYLNKKCKYIAHYFKTTGYRPKNEIYYAIYDFCNDGLPELVISVKGTEISPIDKFQIVGIYGNDGTNIQNLVEEPSTGGPAFFEICENNVVRCSAYTGGRSTSLILFHQMEKYAGTAKVFDALQRGVDFTAQMICENGEITGDKIITYEEFLEIKNQYPVREDIPFNWNPIL